MALIFKNFMIEIKIFNILLFILSFEINILGIEEKREVC